MRADAAERLQALLQRLGGVRRAVVDRDPAAVWLVCERSEAPTELLVRTVMAEEGLASADIPLEIAYLSPGEPRRRVRFLAVRVSAPHTGRGRAEVELEWAGRSFRGGADGETGSAMELRLAAVATLRSLEAVLQGEVRFDLLGSKQVRAFDADVVVALIRGPGEGALVGASLGGGDPFRAAALAVLNATNRVLGNYLAVGEPRE
jgi:hypothetical protein